MKHKISLDQLKVESFITSSKIIVGGRGRVAGVKAQIILSCVETVCKQDCPIANNVSADN